MLKTSQLLVTTFDWKQVKCSYQRKVKVKQIFSKPKPGLHSYQIQVEKLTSMSNVKHLNELTHSKYSCAGLLTNKSSSWPFWPLDELNV